MSTNSDTMPGITLHLSADDLERLLDRKLQPIFTELAAIKQDLATIKADLKNLTARVVVVEGLAKKIPSMEVNLHSQD
ncbi:hypothetical protein NW760_007307 [Fusarium oxysporum]|nr:hypothetical protein NW769_000281 [Fusarium oxysporum]KAJ4229454.1 hypothetical protein NW760_007307 [Fusarium oxysporum]